MQFLQCCKVFCKNFTYFIEIIKHIKCMKKKTELNRKLLRIISFSIKLPF